MASGSSGGNHLHSTAPPGGPSFPIKSAAPPYALPFAPPKSRMPLPPPYFLLYTDENVRKGRIPKPPVPPADNEEFQMFGQTVRLDDVLVKPLESHGIRRLYPQNFDHRRELKKLNVSLLVNFLDLLDVIAVNPESPKRQEKMDDINLLLINMEHLINEFRPLQARETMRVMMEFQKGKTLENCEALQKQLEKCVDLIKQGLQNEPEQFEEDSAKYAFNHSPTKEPKEKESESGVMEEDRMMCEIVDAL